MISDGSLFVTVTVKFQQLNATLKRKNCDTLFGCYRWHPPARPVQPVQAQAPVLVGGECRWGLAWEEQGVVPYMRGRRGRELGGQARLHQGREEPRAAFCVLHQPPGNQTREEDLTSAKVHVVEGKPRQSAKGLALQFIACCITNTLIEKQLVLCWFLA